MAARGASGVPEGDTIYRTAALLRPVLEGQPVLAARARRPGPMIARVIGATVTAVESRGKHLVIHFSNGLALHTHMRMTGVWHRYAPGERWRRPEAQARVVLETPAGLAVCFNAPVAELLREAAAGHLPSLARLGPDLLGEDFDAGEVLERMAALDPATPVAEVLLDQRVMAGVGNVYKSEVLFLEGLHPRLPLGALDGDARRRLVERCRALLRANRLGTRRTTTPARLAGQGERLWVYGKAGRPCPRCRTRLVSAQLGGELPRVTTWCPACQPLPGPA